VAQAGVRLCAFEFAVAFAFAFVSVGLVFQRPGHPERSEARIVRPPWRRPPLRIRIRYPLVQSRTWIAPTHSHFETHPFFPFTISNHCGNMGRAQAETAQRPHMVSTRRPEGAGRIATGSLPTPTRTPLQLTASAVPYLQAAQRSASTGQPLTFSSSIPAISNRNFSRLEIPATHRKHSSAAKSNRNFRSTIFAHEWGSKSWLRNAAPTTCNCACTKVPSSATPPCPPPFSSPSVKCALFASAVAGSTPLFLPSRSSQSRISNRHWMRLEIAVTHRKHSPDLISNRHKNTLHFFASVSLQTIFCVPRANPVA
jgi:hypothetical protein